MNSECKNYPIKEFLAIFPVSSILVIRSGYAKKDHFSILPEIQNIWDLHKFWVADLNSERKNYPMKEFRAIFSISSILVIRSVYAKKDHFLILAVIQNIWDLHKFGLQILNSQHRNYPMKEFRAIFLISSILVIISQY